ncbi:MAG: hypothetical protein AVDCRST_MAG73-3738 [uncultured Thermomicrobiales bacterium]|uniref:YfhO family protein n=1 Tax=uncultured Thermomicrobiales bacterium TaxID=1645740 RepID=A0A6J4UVU9_9BACT|nr:MAG: hypothetical protein AVDCRST_MAG73-3738 [uncultured Thermomicrobiales bacterium]
MVDAGDRSTPGRPPLPAPPSGFPGPLATGTSLPGRDTTGPPAPATTVGPRPVARGDALGVAVLAVLTAVVAWNRLGVDPWMARVDVLTFFLPWYAFMGDRLRALDVPGWNPHLFAGAPFAGDPESGWMYLPAMLFFPFLSAVAAFKAMVLFQLAVAGASTYALARVLRMGATAGLVAAVVFAFGPFLHWNTYCCTIRVQLATWIPLALLGVELALRAGRWRDRVAPWFLAGFALTQMFSGWLGQGLVNGLLLVGSYLGYRALLSPARPGRGLRDRLVVGATTGAAILGLGLAVGAAGILPRLELNPETNLAGGRYDELVGGHNYPPYPFADLLRHLLGDGYDHRAVALGGTAVVLSLLAPALARRRFAVPYFATTTVVVFALSLDTTPLHRLFYLIPRFRVLHEHAPHQVNAVAMIGPAILTGAAVEALGAWRGRRRLLPLVAAPLAAMTAATVALRQGGADLGWMPLLAAAAVTGLVALVLAVRRDEEARPALGRAARSVPALILAVAFLQPTGQEVAESWLGRPLDPGWARFWPPDPVYDRAVAVNAARTDPGGAGAFLRARLAEAGPFRYVGYGGVAHPDEGPSPQTYQHRRTRPNIQAILVNARALRLGLHDVQGYKAVQLKRYVEFLTALNGETQEYHVANLRPGGVRSPLLDLLNVRYVVVDAGLPQDREDVAALTAGRPEVFRTAAVVVYESGAALPRAWIVHDVRPVVRGGALGPLASGAVDPRRTAFVEGPLPPVAVPPESAVESARVTRHEPDAIEIVARAAAPGLLVVSEVYSTGWRAYVDGERVEVLPTNHALRGVPIAPGEHHVELRYEPRSLRLGVPISGASALAMLVAFAAAGYRHIRMGGHRA